MLWVELDFWGVGSNGGTGGMKLKYWTWNLLPASLCKSFRWHSDFYTQIYQIFFSCCFYCGSQNQSPELWLKFFIMCLISRCWCMSGFLIGEWEETKDRGRNRENIYSVLSLICSSITLYIVNIFRWHCKRIFEADSYKLEG